MPSTIIPPDELAAREQAMLAKTPYQIFTEAADIIEKDPVLTVGAYSEPRWINKTTGVPLSSYYLESPYPTEDLEAWEAKPCHCLEGAMQEAGGLYTPDPDKPGWLAVIVGLDTIWSRHWERSLNETLIQTFDLDKMHASGNFNDCNTLEEASTKYSVNDVVYTYSDRVLAPMGRAGAIEAARLLRAAAELVKENS